MIVPTEAGQHFVQESDALFWNSTKTGVCSGSLRDDRVRNGLASSIYCRAGLQKLRM